MKVLLAGGAGYIGSHTAIEIAKLGHDIVIADDFSNSKPEAVNRIKTIIGKDFPFYEVDIADKEKLRALFDEIREKFDYCLVDAPAGLETGFRLALTGADRAVVVTNTDESSLRDAQRTVMELSHLPRGRVHLIVNRCRKKLMKSLHQTIDDAIDIAGLPLLGVIPEDETMPLYAGRGVPLLMSENQYAAEAYRNIARRIAGQRTPLLRIR